MYFKTQSDYQRLFLSIEGQDLTCYLDDTKQKVKFMHSMVNCQIKYDSTLLIKDLIGGKEGHNYRQV